MAISHNSRMLQHPTFESFPGYWARHEKALIAPHPGFEFAVASLLKGWTAYADAHKAAYGSGIGDDGVLGAPWAAIGRALRTLLNGSCGHLDCGAIDGAILACLAAEGCGEGEEE